MAIAVSSLLSVEVWALMWRSSSFSAFSSTVMSMAKPADPPETGTSNTSSARIEPETTAWMRPRQLVAELAAVQSMAARPAISVPCATTASGSLPSTAAA